MDDNNIKASAVRIAASMVQGKGSKVSAEEVAGNALRIAQIIASGNVPASQKTEPTGLKPRDPVPYKEIYELFAKWLPNSPAPMANNDTRKQRLRVIWNEDKRYQNLQFWDAFFAYCGTVDWMIGKSEGIPPASIDTILRPKNFPRYVDNALQAWDKRSRANG